MRKYSSLGFYVFSFWWFAQLELYINSETDNVKHAYNYTFTM